MIHLKNIVEVWDDSALALKDGLDNKNVYEYNLNLLGLMYHASRNEKGREILTRVFGMKDSSVMELQNYSLEDLHKLASEVILIVALDMDEDEILKALEKEYDPHIYLDEGASIGEFDVAYWLLLNKEAARDVLHASVMFDVSIHLAEAVARASDAQLRSLRISQPKFRLRFKESQLQSNKALEAEGISYLQRMQQAFVRT